MLTLIFYLPPASAIIYLPVTSMEQLLQQSPTAQHNNIFCAKQLVILVSADNYDWLIHFRLFINNPKTLNLKQQHLAKIPISSVHRPANVPRPQISKFDGSQIFLQNIRYLGRYESS